MKTRIIFSIVFLFCMNLFSQDASSKMGIGLNSAVSSKADLPFWLTANQFGEIPNSDFGSLNVFYEHAFSKPENNWDVAYKGSFSGVLSDENLLYVNELYTSVRHGGLILTIGNKYNNLKWEGLSSSNGNFIKSINAREMPGINLETNGFVKLGFWDEWFSVKANYSEYLMNDDRKVEGTNVHHKSLHFRFKTSETFSFNVGLDDWAQWGGTSSKYGEQPEDFNSYVRMVLGMSGGGDSNTEDQINALGNHMGSYLFEFNHTGEKLNWNIYWSHPFEDRSGREMMNWPDALYGLAIDFKNPNGLVSHLVTEVTYTKHVSGSDPHYIDENGNPRAASGRDQYFKNYLYESGWSYFGRTIGTPYIITEMDENGIANGPDRSYNRFFAFNIGAKGYLNKVAYKGMLSYVRYFEWFGESFDATPRQFSGYGSFDFTELINCGFGLELTGAFDVGNRLPDSFGGFLKIYKNFTF